MLKNLLALVCLTGVLLAAPAFAQSNVIINCQTGTTSTGAPIYAPASAANPCPVTGAGSGGTPTPVVPGQLTFLGQQKISAATLAATTALTVPATATIADFYPECTTNGTDGQCVRFNPGGTTDASAGSGLGSQQLLLGYSGGLATIQFILAAGATGAAGTIPTLTVNYYK